MTNEDTPLGRLFTALGLFLDSYDSTNAPVKEEIMTTLHHIEVTSDGGGSKWIRGIVSHTVEEIKDAFKENTIITLVDSEGGETLVDMSIVFMMRLQDDSLFKRRSADQARHRQK